MISTNEFSRQFTIDIDCFLASNFFINIIPIPENWNGPVCLHLEMAAFAIDGNNLPGLQGCFKVSLRQVIIQY